MSCKFDSIRSIGIGRVVKIEEIVVRLKHTHQLSKGGTELLSQLFSLLLKTEELHYYKDYMRKWTSRRKPLIHPITILCTYNFC